MNWLIWSEKSWSQRANQHAVLVHLTWCLHHKSRAWLTINVKNSNIKKVLTVYIVSLRLCKKKKKQQRCLWFSYLMKKQKERDRKISNHSRRILSFCVCISRLEQAKRSVSSNISIFCIFIVLELQRSSCSDHAHAQRQWLYSFKRKCG